MIKESILYIVSILANPFYLFWILASSIFIVFVGLLILYLDSDVDF